MCSSDLGVVHDINIAIRYADELIFFKEGTIVKNGAPLKMVDASLIKEVFNIQTQVIAHPSTAKPIIVF